jgi:hypothetical protein
MLDGLPPNAIVFTQQWDFWEAGSFYLQEVEGFRKDVMVIDVDDLHIDWYVDQLSRAFPQVMATVRGNTAQPLVLLGDCWPPVVESWRRHLVVEERELPPVITGRHPLSAVTLLPLVNGRAFPAPTDPP